MRETQQIEIGEKCSVFTRVTVNRIEYEVKARLVPVYGCTEIFHIYRVLSI